MSVYYWLLGMSLGAVTDALDPFGCHLGRTTVFDNLRQTGTVARRRLRERLRSKITVRVVAMDFTHVTEQGHDTAVMHTSDASTGLTLEITPLHAEDEHTITRYVQWIAKLTGCEVILTDDADTFKTAADAAGVPRHVGVPAARGAEHPDVVECDCRTDRASFSSPADPSRSISGTGL